MPGGGSSSMASSAISMNLKLTICLTTLVGREAAGLNGPLLTRRRY